MVDTCIIGAGVVGLAVARAMSLRCPGSVILLERNASFGEETSSRNSEVIHAGLYYPPDSLKAKFCLRGRQLLLEYCTDHDVPWRRTGKLIVAQTGEYEALKTLAENALRCGLARNDLEWLDRQTMQRLEPALQGEHGLLSHQSGIIDSHTLMTSLLQEAESAGVTFVPHTEVHRIEVDPSGFHVHTGSTTGRAADEYVLPCKQVVNCAGLHASAIAGCIDDLARRHVPDVYLLKGSYFSYSGKSPFSHLIYPLPPASGQGLGIHATLDMGGQVRFGPDTQRTDSLDYRVDPARRLQFAKAIRRYYPDLDADRLEPAYAGIRPRLATEGFSDFRIQDSREHGIPGLLQLFGIDSPGLTASLALAEAVTERLIARR